jgi:hypothetical protein
LPEGIVQAAKKINIKEKQSNGDYGYCRFDNEVL